MVMVTTSSNRLQSTTPSGKSPWKRPGTTSLKVNDEVP
jgi:hypothetical protein